ncbi:MAG: energy-coupling factor transporter transmembrane protein EcfT [Spirochaetales bacterium]|nr:energy-coupling factor transporter transmembrane protein EcfT [Spirochaetales bacterium]
MAESIIFHFRPGKSSLHRLDCRFKLLLMVLLTVSIFSATYRGLFLISLCVLSGVFTSRLIHRGFLRDFRGFLLILSLIFLSRTLTEGLIFGLSGSWRFLLVILLGMVLSATTDPADIHGAVYWYLKRLPFIKAGDIGTRVSLAITLIPLILDQTREVTEAQKSRFIEGQRNPVFRILAQTLPLLVSTLYRSREITLALESRCYDENTPPHLSRPASGQWLLFLSTAAISISGILV